MCAVAAAACSNDDDVRFDTTLTRDMFSFQPTEGGAVLNYTIQDPDAMFVKAEYINAYGEKILKKGAVATNSMILSGFENARQGVPVVVSLLDRNDHESKLMDMTFDTKASVLFTLLDDADTQVIPYWDGFQLNMDIPEGTNVEGFVNIYVVGTNPTTNETDTLLVNNGHLQLRTGKSFYAFTMPDEAKKDYNTIVVKTEDFKSRIVKTKKWENVAALSRVMMDNRGFELIDPWNLSWEVNNVAGSGHRYRYGKEFLFDGDKTGVQYAQNVRSLGYVNARYTWLAGPDASQERGNNAFFVLDIGQATTVGQLRFYGQFAWDGSGNAQNADLSPYQVRLPCQIRVSGSTDYDPAVNNKGGTWEVLGEFLHDRKIALADRWYRIPDGYSTDRVPTVSTLAAMLDATPYYCGVDCQLTGNEYRYLKIEFLATYEWSWSGAGSSFANTNADVTLHEIDVFARKQ